MKRFVLMTVVVCAFPAFGHAQTIPMPNSLFANCGQIRLGNDSRQYR